MSKTPCGFTALETRHCYPVSNICEYEIENHENAIASDGNINRQNIRHLRAVSKARDAAKGLNRAGKKAVQSGAHNEAASAFSEAKILVKAASGGANATTLNKLIKLVHKKEKDMKSLVKSSRLASAKLEEERRQEALSFIRAIQLKEEEHQEAMSAFEMECHQRELQKAHNIDDPQPPLSLSIPRIVSEPDTDMAMAYGLLRCPLCGYNEGDKCPTHNMGGRA
jgi:hypothetical protein